MVAVLLCDPFMKLIRKPVNSPENMMKVLAYARWAGDLNHTDITNIISADSRLNDRGEFELSPKGLEILRNLQKSARLDELGRRDIGVFLEQYGATGRTQVLSRDTVPVLSRLRAAPASEENTAQMRSAIDGDATLGEVDEDVKRELLEALMTSNLSTHEVIETFLEGQRPEPPPAGALAERLQKAAKICLHLDAQGQLSVRPEVRSGIEEVRDAPGTDGARRAWLTTALEQLDKSTKDQVLDGGTLDDLEVLRMGAGSREGRVAALSIVIQDDGALKTLAPDAVKALAERLIETKYPAHRVIEQLLTGADPQVPDELTRIVDALTRSVWPLPVEPPQARIAISPSTVEALESVRGSDLPDRVWGTRVRKIIDADAGLVHLTESQKQAFIGELGRSREPVATVLARLAPGLEATP